MLFPGLACLIRAGGRSRLPDFVAPPRGTESTSSSGRLAGSGSLEQVQGSDPFAVHGKWVVLRQSRLGKTPPALYATELLAERGYPVLAVEFGNAWEPSRAVREPFARYRLAHPVAARLPWPFRRVAIFLSALARILGRVIFDGRPHCFVAHGLVEQVLACALNFLTGVPYVVHVHEGYAPSDELSPFNRFLFRLEGPALRGARVLIFPEVERARIYRARYRLAQPYAIAFNAPRLRRGNVARDVRGSLGLPASSRLVAYLGGIGPHNALGEMVEALGELDNVHLLLWGWEDAVTGLRLRERARALGVTGRIHFLGELHDDKWEWLAGCDVGYCVYEPVCFRLRYAATASNKLMEYWAAGLPVVTSSEPDFRRLVESHDVGVCAERISSPAIRRAVGELLADPKRLQQRKENARRAHLETFHFEAQFQSALWLTARELSGAAADRAPAMVQSPLPFTR